MTLSGGGLVKVLAAQISGGLSDVRRFADARGQFLKQLLD